MNWYRAGALLFLTTTMAIMACSREPQVKIIVDTDDFADLQQVQIYRTDTMPAPVITTEADTPSTSASSSTSPPASTPTPAQASAPTPPTINGIAFLLGTEADWRAGSTQLARKLAASGWLVAGIHFDSFVDARKAQNVDCLELVTLLDVFSQHLQQRYRISNYQRPLLIGYGQGGSAAYLTLAQSSAGIFRGAVSLGLDAQIKLPIAFCDHDGAVNKKVADDLQLLPVPRVAPQWSVWTGRSDAAQQDLLQAMKAAQIHRDNIDADDDIDDWLPEALDDVDPDDNGIADLPLVEMPVKNGSKDYFAVIISGDGGWANIDKDIGNALNARGIDVVGWNSLQYFWNRRTPDTAAADLTRVMQYYRAQWHKPRVLLIGYSLGADVLPFMLSRMPPTETNTLASIVLLSVSTSVDFEFHVSNWIDVDSSTEQQTLPELAKISAMPVQCFYGSDDDDTACRTFKAPTHWHIVELPGDHHFDGAYEKVTDMLLTNAGLRAAP